MESNKREVQGTQRRIATVANFIDTEWALLYSDDVNAAFWSDPLLSIDEDGRASVNAQERFLNEMTDPIAGDVNLINENRILSEKLGEGLWNEVDYVAWVMIPASIRRMGGWYWYFKKERELLIKNK